MPLTPDLTPTVAVFHGDGNITLYHPGSDGVTAHESVMGYNGAMDVSLEFRSFGTSHLRPIVPLRDTLECLGLPDPYSPAALEAAYEAAEEPTDDAPIRAGDVMIFPVPDGYAVRRTPVDYGMWRSDTRILSRAPKPREPWQDLADDLAGRSTVMGDLEATARMLHEQGWRKGGDES